MFTSKKTAPFKAELTKKDIVETDLMAFWQRTHSGCHTHETDGDTMYEERCLLESIKACKTLPQTLQPDIDILYASMQTDLDNSETICMGI